MQRQQERCMYPLECKQVVKNRCTSCRNFYCPTHINNHGCLPLDNRRLAESILQTQKSAMRSPSPKALSTQTQNPKNTNLSSTEYWQIQGALYEPTSLLEFLKARLGKASGVGANCLIDSLLQLIKPRLNETAREEEIKRVRNVLTVARFLPLRSSTDLSHIAFLLGSFLERVTTALAP